MIEVNCETCDKSFSITPSRYRKNKHHTCSRLCLGKLSSIIQSKKIKTNCSECTKEIFYKQSVFKEIAYPTCSKECSIKNKVKRNKGQANPRALDLTEFQKIFWNKNKNYAYRAKAKNMNFNLDYEFLIDLYTKQKGLCHYTGLLLKLEGKKDFDTISLDRVNSEKGYIKDNVVFCVNSINMLKADYPLSTLEKLFSAIRTKGSYENKV